jgi:hypothetical protein
MKKKLDAGMAVYSGKSIRMLLRLGSVAKVLDSGATTTGKGKHPWFDFVQMSF